MILLRRSKQGSTIKTLNTRWYTLIFFFFITLSSVPAEDLPLKFQFPTGGRIRGTPVFSSFDTFYFLAEDRYLYCLDLSGNLVWRYFLKERITDILALGIDESIYTALRNGNFIALNPKGKEIFRINLGVPVLYNPIVTNYGEILLFLEDQSMISLSHKGKVRWKGFLPGFPILPPVLLYDTLFIPLEQNIILGYAVSGEEICRIETRGRVTSLLSAPGQSRVFFGTSEGSLYCADSSGVVMWERVFSTPVNGIFPGMEGYYLLLSTGEVVFIDYIGEVLWQKSVDISATRTIPLRQGLILCDRLGNTRYIDLRGESLSSGRLSVTGDISLATKEDLLLGGGEDWNIYAWSLPDSSLQRNSSEKRGKGSEGLSIYNNLPEYRYLKTLIDQPDYQLKRMGLSGITEICRSDNLQGKIPFLMDLLVSLSTDALLNPGYMYKQIINDFPDLRFHSIILLGEIGNLSIKPVLGEIIKREWNDAVLTAAVLVAGDLASDLDGSMTRAISEVLNRRTENLDRDIIRASVRSLEQIRAYHGFIMDPEGVQSLLMLVVGEYPRDIRKYALEVLRKMGEL